MMKATKQIANMLGCNFNEIIYTSGASESNSTAIKGIAFKYANRGKHIITSYYEHKSIVENMDYLSTLGYEISYVNLNSDGSIDLKHLESLGFVSGASIKILARNKSGHIIQIQEGRLALDFDVSNHILVKW